MNKIANILASTDYGSIIINRFDYLTYTKPWGEEATDGVGYNLLETSTYEKEEVQLSCDLLRLQSRYFPGGMIALDIGANIGIYSLAWMKTFRELNNDGQIIAFEPQEWVFYSLCGNIALNNCYQVRAVLAAISDVEGTANVPRLDYKTPCSYGSLMIEIDYPDTVPIQQITIDSCVTERLDFMKIDVETMEMKVLKGAEATITKHRPIIMMEFYHDPTVKDWIAEKGYRVEQISNMNVICVPNESPVISHLIRKEEVCSSETSLPDSIS